MPQGKFFQMVSQMNGLCLDVQASGTDPGTQVFMWDKKDEDDDCDNQMFWADTVYGTIRTKLNDFCLEVDDSNTLIINPYEEGNDNQQWQISGDKVMKRSDTDKVLDVARAEEDERTRVCAWDWHGEENQLWEFPHASAKYFYIKSDMHGKVLDVRRAETDPGTKVVMYDQGDAEDNQLWYEDKYGVIRSKLTDFLLDSSKGNSIRCQPFEPGNGGQLWHLIDHKIVNREDGKKVLDIKKSCEDNGTKLCSYKYQGQDNQHFTIEYVD